MQVRIKLFGEINGPRCYRIRDFLQRNGMRVQWTVITRNEDALLDAALD
jgi:hypothetical protein